MAKINSLFHKIKSIVGYSFAIVVIFSALGVSGMRFLLTTANLYHDEVEQFASDVLNQPVKIGRMDAKLSGLVPTLIFHDVQLISEDKKKSLFSLSRIDVGLLFDDLLWHQKITPKQVTVKGMNLNITRTEEGKLIVKGNLKTKGIDLNGLITSEERHGKSTSLFERWLTQQGEIGLEDSTLTWRDEQKAGVTWFFNDVNFLLRKYDDRHQFLFSSKLPEMLGDKIKVAFDLTGDISTPASWKINSFIETKSLKIKAIQKYIRNTGFKINNGIVDLKLWADFNESKLKQLSGDLKLYNLLYKANNKKPVSLKLISGIFDSHYDENNTWDVSVDKFTYYNHKEVLRDAKFSLSINSKNKKTDTYHIKTDHLEIDALSKVITDNHFISDKYEERINNLNIHGDIRNFYVSWNAHELQQLKAEFNDFGMNAWKNIPKVESLSGNVTYGGNEGIISISSENAIVGLPTLFRDDFNLDKLTANIKFINTKQGMLFDAERVSVENREVNAVSSVKLWLPKSDASPYLDLQTYIKEGDISKVSHFLPTGIMDESLVSWLDQGLLAGYVEKCTVIYNGKLNDFPFDKNEGVFSVDVETSNLTLHYRDGWPKIKNAKIEGGFTGQGMDLHLLTGKVNNNVIYDSYAKIASFSKADLQLNVNTSGTTKNTMNYLINSPVLPGAKKAIENMSFLGFVDTKITVGIPLDDELSKKYGITYSGSSDLRDVSVFMAKDKIDITQGRGKIFFTDEKLSGKDIFADVLGKKAILSLTSAKNSVQITAKGKIEPNVVLKRFKIPGAKKISGNTSYNAIMTFPDKELKNSYPTLRLHSNLSGIKSSLPEYFHKRKNTRQNFSFTTEFMGDDKVRLGVKFGKKASAILELDQSKNDVFLRRGAIAVSSKKAVLPNEEILYIDGVVNNITPTKWLKALELNKGKNKQNFFINPIVLNLDKLEILIEDENKEEKIGAANPLDLPGFEGVIKKLYFDKIFLGKMNFIVSKKRYGLRLDEMILSEKNGKFEATGDWFYNRGSHKTNLVVTLQSKDFGSMLTDMDFSAIIEHGQANMLGKFNWDDAATHFSLEKLNGNIKLKIKDGSVVEVDSGAGRLLGLFSLSALPRKLFGDFKDTFKEGFHFDTAEGEFDIKLGEAKTDDFKISSTVADVTVNGSTGLADRTHDSKIEVVPNIGAGLVGATALLVNLPSAISLWLLDKLTGQQLNHASTRIYEITGSWDKPVIELIEEEVTEEEEEES